MLCSGTAPNSKGEHLPGNPFGMIRNRVHLRRTLNCEVGQMVPEVGLERRQAIDNTQVIDFTNAMTATISWFGGKLVRIEYTARVNFRKSVRAIRQGKELPRPRSARRSATSVKTSSSHR